MAITRSKKSNALSNRKQAFDIDFSLWLKLRRRQVYRTK